MGIVPDSESTDVSLAEVGLGPYSEYPDSSLRLEYIAWVGGAVSAIDPNGALVHPKLRFVPFDASVDLATDPLAGHDHYVVETAATGWYTVIVPVRPDLDYDKSGLAVRFVNGNAIADLLVGQSLIGVRAAEIDCRTAPCTVTVSLSQPRQFSQDIVGAIVLLDKNGGPAPCTTPTAPADLSDSAILEQCDDGDVAAMRVDRGLVADDGKPWGWPPVGAVQPITWTTYTNDPGDRTWVPNRRGLADQVIPTPDPSVLQPASPATSPGGTPSSQPSGCETAGGGATAPAIILVVLLTVRDRRRRD